MDTNEQTLNVDGKKNYSIDDDSFLENNREKEKTKPSWATGIELTCSICQKEFPINVWSEHVQTVYPLLVCGHVQGEVW